MWHKITEYHSHGITATSWRSRRTRITEKFEIGLFFGTHESRGLTSSKLLTSKSCRYSIIVLFDEKDTLGLRDKYDLVLQAQVADCSENKPELVCGEKRNVMATLKQILDKIPESAYGLDKRWFVDIVGAPKPHYLCLLGHMRRLVKSPKLTLFHPSGNYEKVTPGKEAFSFTSGLDRYMWIPYFWGRPDPTLPYTFVFLLGFEGHRSYEIYDRFEPRYVKALISEPGYTEKYVLIAKKENEVFIREAEPEIIFAHAADPVETWKKLHDSFCREEKQSNLCIVPLGPKPHALGGALFALTNNSAGVLYLMPRTFKFKDTHRGEFIWRYEIRL